MRDTLTPRDVLILQQIHEDGTNDVIMLGKELGEPLAIIMSRLYALRQKRLIVLIGVHEDAWVYLSSRGLYLVSYLWPEMAAV